MSTGMRLIRMSTFIGAALCHNILLGKATYLALAQATTGPTARTAGHMCKAAIEADFYAPE
jgi:hypothetical protein